MLYQQLSPNQADVQAALVGWLGTVLPAGVAVIEGSDNDVPEPSAPTFIVVSPILRCRLATNGEVGADCSFVASSVGTTLTVASMLLGKIVVGAPLLGNGVLTATKIASQLSGTPGGVGTYQLSAAQTLISAKYAAGLWQLICPTRIDFQLDTHAEDPQTASDVAQVVQIAFRGDAAWRYFKVQTAVDGTPLDAAPLYADDPKAIPFVNAEQQFEKMWVVTAAVQANQAWAYSQDYADQLQVQSITPGDIVYLP